MKKVLLAFVVLAFTACSSLPQKEVSEGNRIHPRAGDKHMDRSS